MLYSNVYYADTYRITCTYRKNLKNSDTKIAVITLKLELCDFYRTVVCQ